MITLNADRAIADLGAILTRMAHLEPALSSIGARQVREVNARIKDTKLEPDDLPWAPWAPFTRKQREEKGNVPQGLLWDTGTLLHSIRAQTGLNSVTIGTNVPYADELQYGRRDMPPRPFLGWGASDIRGAEMLVIQHIQGVPF